MGQKCPINTIMDKVTSIEYYLNKDHHKNLFFKGNIPPAWEFPGYHWDLKKVASTDFYYPELDNHFRFNNLGYRSNFDYTVESLQDEKCILCLGDSDTAGIAIKHENLWTTHISNAFSDCKVMNMGIAGGAADTVVRNGINTIKSLKGAVKVVLVLWPPYSRREFVSKEFSRLVYKSPLKDDFAPFAEYWKFIDWKANSYNFYKNKILLESICQATDVELHDLEINADSLEIQEDFANTIRHFGNNTHKAIANYFEKKIKKEPSVFEQRSRSL